MRYLVSIVLVALIGFCGYLLAKSIQDPIAFAAEKDTRKTAVIEKLSKIRTLQEIYRAIKNGSFAGSFEELASTIETGQIAYENIVGDPDDPSGATFSKTTSYVSAIDSVKTLGIDLKDLDIVPFSNGKRFEFFADTIDYQSTKVNVVEVKTYWKEFMGEFADPKYKKFDNRYDPEEEFKFGDRTKPNLNGSWQ